MTVTITEILSAIHSLELRMIESTKNAESQCSSIHLVFHSDGSGRIVFSWTQRVVGAGKRLSQEQRGTLNFLATILADDDSAETQEDFESLEELESYLKGQNVL